MIIFDLDGTLADCEHRRHFVDSSKPHPTREEAEQFMQSGCKWKPDWKSFYEACDQDGPIKPTLDLIEELLLKSDQIQIWSGRCESVREKTIKWLSYQIPMTMRWGKGKWENHLKMRPIGDNAPDDELKERWFNELTTETKWGRMHPIRFVVDDRPKVVRMWRRRGIFVFDCNQDGKEF